jgi:protocatechuate 3,4-dioxygenase beta subunit
MYLLTMDLDDLPVGRVLTRRETLALLGSAGALLFLGCSRSGTTTNLSRTSSSCVVRPELTEGPFYVDERLNRSDLRSDPSDGTVSPGALLALTLHVSQVARGSCAPLPGAIVDLWQCDAVGVYSDVRDPRVSASDPRGNTVGKKFLRGHQVTDANGIAKFTTIYPGWYPARTPHIHFKISSPASANSAHEFTSQLFFDDTLTDRVFAREPYAARGQRTLRNSDDWIFKRGGSRLTLNVTPASDGYAATFDIALDNG